MPNHRSHPLYGRVNGRTPRGRRVRALYASLMAKLPDDDANAEATALRAAELSIIAEGVRAVMLACEPDATLASELVRIENLAARARREIARLEDAEAKRPPSIEAIQAAIDAGATSEDEDDGDTDQV